MRRRTSGVLAVWMGLALLAGIGRAATPEVAFRLRESGYVSLAVYDEEGIMRRELLRGEWREAGQHRLEWDGLDGDGMPLPAGTYPWRLLRWPGLETEYLMTLGTSMGIHPWPGVHGGPSSMAVVGEKMYMAGAGSETNPGIACSTLGGDFVWANTGVGGWGAVMDMAVVDGLMWMQYSDGWLKAVGASDGSTARQEDWILTRLPLASLAMLPEGASAPPRFVSVPVADYAAERGFGWLDAGNITAVTVDAEAGNPLHRHGHQAQGLTHQTPRILRVDVPASHRGYLSGRFQIRLHFSDAHYRVTDYPDASEATLPGEVPMVADGLLDDLLREIDDKPSIPVHQSPIVHVQQGGQWKGTFDASKTRQAVLAFDVETPASHIDLTFYHDEQERPFGFTLQAVEVFALADLMDARAEQMVVASSRASQVLWIDRDGIAGDQAYLHLDWLNGDKPPRVLDYVELPGVNDVALLADGTVLAIRDNELVTFSRADKTPRVRATGLEAPAHLAIDDGNGDILVTQLGTSNQIVRFDSQFRKLATYGASGGRKDGRYVPGNFAGISNIASDHQGGFLVSEWLSPPRRIASFNRAGDLQHEWYGGQMFYHSIGLDPQDPSRIWLNSQFGTLIEMEVDYDARTWRVYSTWIPGRHLDPVLFPRLIGFQVWTHPLMIGEGDQQKRYLNLEMIDGLILDIDYEQGRLIPVAAAGAATTIDADSEHPWRIAAGRAVGEHQGDRNNMHPFRGFTYADLKGDRQMHPEEFRVPWMRGPHGWGHVPGRGGPISSDLSAWTVPVSAAAPLWMRLAPIGFTGEGVPIWDLTTLEAGPRFPDRTGVHVHPLSDETVLTIERPTGDNFGRWWHNTYWEGHGIGWPGTMVNATAVVRRDLAGNILWQSGPHHSGGPGARGRLHQPWRIAGVIGDYLGVTDQIRQPVQFWSLDGLFAGSLFERRADDGQPDRVYTWWRVDESVADAPGNRGILNYDMGGSGRLAQRPNGDVLFFAAGWNNVPVYRVNGWERMERLQGSVRVPSAQPRAQAAGTGLQAEYFDTPDLEGLPEAVRVDADVWFGYAHKAKGTGSRIYWPEPEITDKPFSVRWTGWVEPRFSETLRIVFYHRNSGVRVWMDDRLVIDAWDEEKKSFSEPVDVQAGRKVPIRIEWRQLKPDPEAHLNWESLSQPIQHIPPAYLYPP